MPVVVLRSLYALLWRKALLSGSFRFSSWRSTQNVAAWLLLGAVAAQIIVYVRYAVSSAPACLSFSPCLMAVARLRGGGHRISASSVAFS